MRYKSICELYRYPCRERGVVTDAQLDRAFDAWIKSRLTQASVKASLRLALEAASLSRPSGEEKP